LGHLAVHRGLALHLIHAFLLTLLLLQPQRALLLLHQVAHVLGIDGIGHAACCLLWCAAWRGFLAEAERRGRR